MNDRALTGVASCLTWRYRIRTSLRNPQHGWSSDGDSLDLELRGDDSTGGMPPEGGMRLHIDGNWECHEFLSVLQCLVEDLRAELGGTYELYSDDPEDDALVARLGLGPGPSEWRND